MNYIKLILWFKKLITLILIILSFPLYIIYLPIIFVIYVMGQSIILRFGALRSSRIAGFTTSTEMYLCKKALLEKKEEKKFIDFFYLDAISNLYLKKMWKRKLKIFPKFFIWPLENLNKSNIVDKNGIIILHRNKKYKDLLPNKFNIELEKIYGLSKIIFGFF